MKQRAITFIIILLVFLSIFSVNYEVLNKLRSGKVIQSTILTPATNNGADEETGLCDTSGTSKAMSHISTITSRFISLNF